MVAILTIKIGKRKDFALCYPPLKCCLFLRSIVHFNPLGGDTRVNQRGLLRPCILNAEGLCERLLRCPAFRLLRGIEGGEHLPFSHKIADLFTQDNPRAVIDGVLLFSRPAPSSMEAIPHRSVSIA